METLDFSRLMCPVHPKQQLSNYCLNDQCFKPLCATCICEHTARHMTFGTQPKYTSIKNLHEDSQQTIFQCVETLDEQRDHVKALISRIKKRREQFEETIAQARIIVLKQVENAFEQVKKNFQKDIAAQQQRIGLYSYAQLDELNAGMVQQRLNLFNDAQKLNSMGFLAHVQSGHQGALRSFNNFSSAVSQRLPKNENFDFSINFRTDMAADICSFVKKMFSLNFRYARGSTPLSQLRENPIPDLMEGNFNRSFFDDNNLLKENRLMRRGSQTRMRMSEKSSFTASTHWDGQEKGKSVKKNQGIMILSRPSSSGYSMHHNS